jgi:hypothetical protein
MESLFGSELDDPDECYFSIPTMDKPRMCDVALHELAALFPIKYSFHPKRAMEAQLKAAMRTFGKRNEQKPTS